MSRKKINDANPYEERNELSNTSSSASASKTSSTAAVKKANNATTKNATTKNATTKNATAKSASKAGAGKRDTQVSKPENPDKSEKRVSKSKKNSSQKNVFKNDKKINQQSRGASEKGFAINDDDNKPTIKKPKSDKPQRSKISSDKQNRERVGSLATTEITSVKSHLVTGASGYLGTLLVKKLLEKGDAVKAIDISDFPINSILTKEERERFSFYKGDAANYAVMLDLSKGVDTLYHLVAQVPLRRPSREFKIANEDTPKIAAKAAAYNKVRKMVLISSSAVYGLPRFSPLDEETQPLPFEPYGASKLKGEENAKKFLANTETELVIIRPRTIISAHRLGIFDTLFNFISENRNLYLIGRSNHPLQFIHANDLINAIVLLAEKGSGTYAVGTDKYATLESDLRELISYANSASKIKHLPKALTIHILAILYKLRLSPLSPWHYKGYANRFDVTTERASALGWRPEYSNLDMLKEAYDSYLEDKDKSELNSIHSKALKQGIIKIIRKLS